MIKYLHTMIRVANPEATIKFFALIGLRETRRINSEAGRFTLIYLAADEDYDAALQRRAPEIELTWNWDDEEYSGGRNFGHLAFQVADIYAICDKLMSAGVTINRPPRDGHMAFVKTPDGISIEFLQKGERKKPSEPWLSMPNTGSW